MGATLFAVGVSILILGWLWFYIVRPILEDYGVIVAPERVKDYEDAAPVVMSRSGDAAPEKVPPSLQTDDRQTTDRPMMPVPTPNEMLDIFRVLRAAGVKREALQGAWRAAGLKLDNNLWRDAAPTPAEPVTVTPIAHRPTNAQFQSDPEFAYEPPPR